MLKSSTESKLSKILRTLGSKDSIRILRFAKIGFEGTSDAHKRLGLSVKQYYYRLEKLMDAGLVLRKNEKYELTPFGAIVCDFLEKGLFWAIENTGQLQVLQTLKSSKSIDDETLKRVATNLFGSELTELQLGISGKVFQAYEELVGATVKLTEKAKEKIYLATRYSDIRAAEAGWRAVKRGVNIMLIDGAIEHFSGRMKLVETLVRNPKSIKMMYELWHTDKVEFRYREIPFSFMVVDDRDCCFEILNPSIQGFFVAIEFDNNIAVCTKLIKTFENLWRQGAKKDPFVSFTDDLMKEAGE
jgi:DNA-binding HxlR family transcriptional regulator